MDFTREPIIETIITPKDGCKLVVRSTKSTGQEEYCVDAVEIVSFGRALFYRSLDRPKAFLAPVSDFEVLEVREARMVLKNATFDRSIKIGSGREASHKATKETEKSNAYSEDKVSASEQEGESAKATEEEGAENADVKMEKKRDKRRQHRKRRGKEDFDKKDESGQIPSTEEEGVEKVEIDQGTESSSEEASKLPPHVLSSLLQPPPTLISETINRYRQNDLFKGAFYLSEEDQYQPHDKVDALLNEEDSVVHQQAETTFDQLEQEKEDSEQPHEPEERNLFHFLPSDQVEPHQPLASMSDNPQESFEFWPYSHFDRIEEVRELKKEEGQQEPFSDTESRPEESAALPLYAEEENIDEQSESSIVLPSDDYSLPENVNDDLKNPVE